MKEQSKPTREVLEQIKTKELHIKPKWHFTLLRSARWVGIIIIGFFAAINFSIAYFFITSESIPMFSSLAPHGWRIMLFAMPAIWLAIFAVLIVIAYKQFHATKQGYRYRFWIVIATLAVLTFIPGIALSKIGFAYKTYEFAKEHVPGYENIDMHDMFWNRPERGLLTGRVTNLNNESEFELKFRRENWTIDSSETELIETSEIQTDDFVRLYGELTSENTFTAHTILLLDHPRSRH